MVEITAYLGFWNILDQDIFRILEHFGTF